MARTIPATPIWRAVTPTKYSGGEFPLPRFDQKQGNSARGMNGETTNPSVNTGVTLLAAVCIACMGAEGTDPLDDRSHPA